MLRVITACGRGTGLFKHQASPLFIGPRHPALELEYIDTKLCDLMASSEHAACLESLILERPGYVDVIVTTLVDVVSAGFAVGFGKDMQS